MRLVACVLASVALLVASGCSGAVTGQVSSKSEQKPVPAATVTVGDQSVVSDASGRFTVKKVTTGSQKVTVNAEGYGPFTQSLEVKKGDNTLNVTLEDGTVRGVLTENAVVREPINKSTVTVAGEKAKVSGRRFELTGVPVGTQTVLVISAGHQKYKKTVEVVPGDNDLTVQLNLTPLETYMRYYAAYRFNRLREAHRFVHPDVKKHESFKAFSKSMKQGGIVVGIKIFGSRTLAKWHPAYAKKTYSHIAAIDRSVRYQDAYGAYSDNYTQHWQQIDGRWYIIYDWRD